MRAAALFTTLGLCACGAPDPVGGPLQAPPAEAQEPARPAQAAEEGEGDLSGGTAAPEGAERVVIRHILIPFDGATGAPFGWSLPREDAREQAEALLRRVQAGEDFATLARQHSRDASAPRGGFLGGGQRGTWVPPFEAAAFALPIGGVSAVVETEFGFHILRREPLDEVRLRHIVVQHNGARGVGPAAPAAARDTEQARARAAEALAALEAGRPFADVAREYSDGAMALRGGGAGLVPARRAGPGLRRGGL